MSLISMLLAVYGSVLSTLLAFLAWRKDRHRVRFFLTYRRHHDWAELVVSVVNVGFRPVMLHDAYFEQAGGSDYLNTLDENLGLPRRLDEGGESLGLSFHAEDIEPATTALVIRDTSRREHRMEFTHEMRDQIEDLRKFAATQIIP